MLTLEHPYPDSFKGLFKKIQHNLSSVSIFEGLTGSKVYADSLEPSWIVSCSNSRILVSGDVQDAGVVEAVQLVVDSGVKAGRKGFVIYYPTDAVGTDIGSHIEGVKPYPNWRNYYLLKLEKTRIPVEPVQGYRIEQISNELLDEDYQNTNLVRNEMRSERASVEDFLSKSFGFCAITEDTIASWCMSEYNADNRFEIGIETHKDHRRRGLALQTAKACINHGIKQGYKSVGWHCWEKNIESNKLAMRLWFKHVLRYPVEYLEVV